MLRVLALGVLISTALTSVASAALTLSTEDIFVSEGTQEIVIGLNIAGTDALNGMTLGFGLNDGGTIVGGTETALITGFSLDQTIWDTDTSLGTVVTPALASASASVPFPNGATILNLPGVTPSTSVSANGVAVFLTLDISSKVAGDTILLNPDFIVGNQHFSVLLGPDNTAIELTSRSGLLTVTAVPEPASLTLLTALLGGGFLRRRRS
ncbi:PEP-CTERM sorting domain-containing protein [Aureliella helgolandensis]|uniref:PEP-CTERM protein-sorting domain-containing protein n=1 Tax=Aureliella helgolandensis TaxID=2527968 RepID=A0A518GFM7_9BACT|nr:PEP-CTERM sorting domain-containing protein [Aureliella helgolandensis]QDV27403.1 hypothetical protein Q31a_57920 [Aureliella helgolandensis]